METQQSTTNNPPRLMDSGYIEYPKWSLFVFCFLFVILYFTYNKETILKIWPLYMFHKQAHTSYQNAHTHSHNTIQTHTALTTRISKLMSIGFTITIWLSFIPTIHQVHSPSPQYMHPPTNQTNDMTPKSNPLPPNIHHLPHAHNIGTYTYPTTCTRLPNIPTHIQHKSNQVYIIHTTNSTITIPPIHSITHIGHIYYITHTHYKNPKIRSINYYTWNNSLLLLQHGDVEPNPGPPSNIFKTLHNKNTQSPTHYWQHHKKKTHIPHIPT